MDRRLAGHSAQRYTKVLTSFALLRATYDKFLGVMPMNEALEWPSFEEWVVEHVHELRRGHDDG